MPRDSAAELASTRRGCIVAPAGYGKTHVLCVAAGVHESGRQLVLTHTHAGVRAVCARLKTLGVPGAKVTVDTIAGFSLRYASRYPTLSGLGSSSQPTSTPEWNAVYEAAARLAQLSVMRTVLTASYTGVYVDEYQDCTMRQHALVLLLAEILPCRVVGDPLQGIFNFPDQETVVWSRDVDPNFDRLDDLDYPWRWAATHPDLGAWLMDVRTALEGGRPIDLTASPATLDDTNVARQIAQCHRVAGLDGTVVAIGTRAADCHLFSRRLNGRYTSMEEIQCKDLLAAAAAIEDVTGPRRAASLILFAQKCMTAIGTALGSMRDRFSNGEIPVRRANTRHPDVLASLTSVASDDSLQRVIEAMDAIEKVDGCVISRRELWTEMRRALKCRVAETQPTLPMAAWHVRDAWRHGGRRVDPRTVSRTLLVKGLEFDHAIVLDAGKHDTRNLYVALTRGSRSLTVLADDRMVNPAG